MSNNTSRKRVEKLFSGMQQLACSEPPNGNGRPKNEDLIECPEAGTRVNNPGSFFIEIEALRARIQELEAQLHEKEVKSVSTPLLYEKEEVGFAYLDNKLMPVRGTQPAVPNDANVIKTPLTSSGRVIGEVQIAQPAERPLTQDDISLANAITQQASLQIENIRLLAAAERARTDAEEATHQFTHRNWETFLDAIHNSERIGFAYDQESVELFINSAPAQYDHEEIMQVLDQQIGRFFIKGNDGLTDEDKSLIGAIAKQVGQQVENIRLLADASRARTEAEDATRRLTRQNWETYTQQEEIATGFVYDLDQSFSPRKRIGLDRACP